MIIVSRTGKRVSLTPMIIGKDKYWLNRQQKLHRDDGPAFESKNGAKLWYKNGKLHREDGPAIENPNGTKSYWLNGKLVEPYVMGE